MSRWDCEGVRGRGGDKLVLCNEVGGSIVDRLTSLVVRHGAGVGRDCTKYRHQREGWQPHDCFKQQC